MKKRGKGDRQPFVDDRGRRVSADSEYGRRLTDLLGASAAIGNSNETRLTWATKFVNDDLKRWHSATTASYGDCLLALGGFALPQNFLGGIELPQPLAATDVAAIHGELSRILQDAVTRPVGEPTWFDGSGLQSGLVRMSARSVKPAVWGSMVRSTSVKVAVLQAVKDLILTAGDRLIACRWASCGKPFVAVRKQQFCDARCAQTFRNDKKAQARLESEARERSGRNAKTTRKR